MDFSTPKRLEPMLEQAQDLMRNHVEPLERRMGEGFGALQPALEQVRSRAKDAGLWVPQLPRELGGGGLSLVEHGLLSEVLGRSPLGHYVCNCQAPDAGNMEILAEYGTSEQKQRWLQPLVAGGARSCFAMTEPEHAGSNPVWMSTRAVLDGEQWVLDGHKWFATGADGADFVIVMAVTDPDAAAHERASMLIVPKETAGLKLVRNIPVMGEAGEGWLSHGELRLQDCRVPAGALLGPRGAGFRIAQARLGPGRIHHCMRWIGICRRALELLCERAATRELAPSDPLGSRQTVQNWIAESQAEIEAARLLVLDAAWTIDNVGAKAARNKISLIKYFASDVLLKVIDRAVQVHGALGLTDDSVLSHFYRHERAARIYDGPDEVHKSVVARRMLRKQERKRS